MGTLELASMVIATVLSLLLQPSQRPSIPPGTTRTFQESAYRVQDLIGKRQFPDALKALDRLPKLNFRIEWDESGIPASRRPEFRLARDEAIQMWESELDGFNVTLGKPGDIKFTFAATLPPNADTSGPAGAVFLLNGPGPGPLVEGVIALARGDRKTSVEARDITNEVAFGIGQYFGLERTKIVRSITNRMEAPYPALNLVQSRERAIVERIQTLRGQMEKAIREKRSFELARPQLTLDTRELIGGTVNQGDVVPFSILVTNSGNAPLEIRVVPDCGCFRIQAPSVIEPGENAVIKATVDTLEFPGNLHKTLFIYSNDPDASLRIIPVKLRSEPAFRFLTEGGKGFIVDETGAKGVVYLSLNPSKLFKIKEFRATGLDVKIKATPWEGMMADPELSEPATTHKGFALELTIPGGLPPGRTIFSVIAETDDPLFPKLETSFFVQQGILMSPENLYLGEMKPVSARAWGVVSRPGRPFKVLRVESDTPSVKGFAESTGEGDSYKIVVTFDGKAEIGPFNANLKVITDDPKQKEIPFRVTATIVR